MMEDSSCRSNLWIKWEIMQSFEYLSTSWLGDLATASNDIDGEAIDDESGISVSLSSDGSTVAIGAQENDGNGTSAGHVRVYQWNGSTWTQIGDDIDGEESGDNSGNSVSLSSDGTIVAIGALNNDVNGEGSGHGHGHVRIYSYNGTTWTRLGQDIDGETTNDRSGYSVSLSSDGTIVAIGTPYNDEEAGTDAGEVNVYHYSSGKWIKLGPDINGEAGNDRSGFSVSLSSDGSVTIGAIQNDGNGEGSYVRVFKTIIPNPPVIIPDQCDFVGSDQLSVSVSDGFTFKRL